jgi:hypothetical protein
MPQLFLHHKNHVVQETWNGMKVICIFFRSHVNGHSATIRCISSGNTCTWVGPLSAHGHWCLGWSVRSPWVLHREGWISGFDPLGRVGVGMHCAEKEGEWLGSMTGPHTKEVWTGKIRPVVQQGFDLFWKDTPLQSVQRCDMLPLVRGRSCERYRKGALKALILYVGCLA